MNIRGCFPLRLMGLIFLLSKGLSRVFASTTVESLISSVLSLLYGPALTSLHDRWRNQLWPDGSLSWCLCCAVLTPFEIARLELLGCVLKQWREFLSTFSSNRHCSCSRLLKWARKCTFSVSYVELFWLEKKFYVLQNRIYFLFRKSR